MLSDILILKKNYSFCDIGLVYSPIFLSRMNVFYPLQNVKGSEASFDKFTELIEKCISETIPDDDVLVWFVQEQFSKLPKVFYRKHAVRPKKNAVSFYVFKSPEAEYTPSEFLALIEKINHDNAFYMIFTNSYCHALLVYNYFSPKAFSFAIKGNVIMREHTALSPLYGMTVEYVKGFQLKAASYEIFDASGSLYLPYRDHDYTLSFNKTLWAEEIKIES